VPSEAAASASSGRRGTDARARARALLVSRGRFGGGKTRDQSPRYRAAHFTAAASAAARTFAGCQLYRASLSLLFAEEKQAGAATALAGISTTPTL
jgi:hypothetical protein